MDDIIDGRHSGASLRKGEVPDEVSRKAEAMTDVFTKSVDKLGASKDLTGIQSQLGSVKAALNDYLEFAKLPPVDDKEYSL